MSQSDQCPKCGRVWKGRAVPLSGHSTPDPDDVLVCDGCGTILQFTPELALRVLPDSELLKLKRRQPDHYALAMFAQRMVRNVN